MTSLSYAEAVKHIEDDRRVFVVTDNNDIVERVWVPVDLEISMIFDDWIEAYSYVLKFKTVARKHRIYGLDPVMFSSSGLFQMYDVKTGEPAPLSMFVVEEVLWYCGSLRRIRIAYDRGDDYDTMIRSLSAHT